MQYNFEWDLAKARINVIKHGVSFKQAAEVFSDPIALTMYDPDASQSNEDRWITFGSGAAHYPLIVVHTYLYKKSDIVSIRIISARKATKREIQQYEQR